jgi:Protein of unknown function (DUF3618)
MTAGEARDAGTQTGSGSAPPADAEALVEEINRTREELGDTVQALAAKADVKARAQQRAAEVSGQLKGRLAGLKQDLGSRVGQLTGKASGTGQTVAGRGKTMLGASQPAARQLAGRATQTGTSAWAATPEPVQRRARQVARAVDDNRGPAIAIAGVTLVGAWLAIRWLRR